MNRIDNDRVQRSMQEDAFAGQLMFEGGDDIGMSAIPDEREDNVRRTDESLDEEVIILKDMQVDEESGNKRGMVREISPPKDSLEDDDEGMDQLN